MLKKAGFAVVVLLGFVSAGCRTPYGGGCADGCCAGNGSCGVSSSAGAGYTPSQQTYAPVPQQQSVPPGYQGSGSRSVSPGYQGSGSR